MIPCQPNMNSISSNTVEKLKTIQISSHDIQNPNNLFQKYTIPQINEIEAKIRNDIDSKKEDLRQMVGERYREIIMAADRIEEMRECTRDIVKSVGGLKVHYRNSVKPRAQKAADAHLQHTLRLDTIRDAERGLISKAKSHNDQEDDNSSGISLDDKTSVSSLRASNQNINETKINDNQEWRSAFYYNKDKSVRLRSSGSVSSASSKKRLYKLACHTRVLIELSDIIQKALENLDFFRAAELLVLGRQCKHNLLVESDEDSLLEIIPALKRPLEKLSMDVDLVKRSIIGALKDHEISLDMATNAAAGLVLLETHVISAEKASSGSRNPSSQTDDSAFAADVEHQNHTEVALKIFLKSRLDLIQQIFADTANYSVKTQSRLSSEIIVNTIYLSFCLFSPSSDITGLSIDEFLSKLKTNLIYDFINSDGQIKQQGSGRKLSFGQSNKPKSYLSNSLKISKLFNRYEDWMVPITFQNNYKILKIQKFGVSSIWVENFYKPLMAYMQNSSKDLFKSVQSIKGLGNIRATVWDSMAESIQIKSQEFLNSGLVRKVFDEVSGELATSGVVREQDTLPEWALGLDEIESISTPFCYKIFQKLTSTIFTENNWPKKSNLWNLFFAENFSDRVQEIIWGNFEHILEESKKLIDLEARADQNGQGGQTCQISPTSLATSTNITMKSQGFTLNIQKITKFINSSINKLSSDLSFCLDQLDTYPGTSVELRLLNNFKDASASQQKLPDQIKGCSGDFVSEFCAFIESKLENRENVDDSKDYVLFLGRLCEALG